MADCRGGPAAGALPITRIGTILVAASPARLRVVPGVEDVVLTTALPSGNAVSWVEEFALDNKLVEPGTFQASQRLTVSPNYLASFGIPLLNGRFQSDGIQAEPVALVSRSFARRYLANENPIGHKVRFTGPGESIPWLTIVGVAEDVLYTWTDKYPEPAIYLNAFRFPSKTMNYAIHTPEMRSSLPR